MGDFVFNIAKGRVVEYFSRVDTNDPANSALIVVLLASSGLEADSVLQDFDTLSAVVAGTTNEATNTGYARKTLTDANITMPSPDDTNDRFDIDIDDQTWNNVSNDGTGAIGKLIICYDNDTTGGTDANIIPLTGHDFVYTPVGSDIVAVIASGGFYRAS